MTHRALFMSAFAAAMFAAPAFAAEGTPELFNVQWGKNVFNFETMPGHPAPPQNINRMPNGMSDSWHLAGDYKNPILTPVAAALLKKRADIIAAGEAVHNEQDQCRPEGPPFSLAMGTNVVFMHEHNGDIMMVTRGDQIRHIRMNASHPANPVPTPSGDSVGHWDGETLVIDTVALKTDALTTADRFGTPQSDKMHVIERYHLIDGAQAIAQATAYLKHEGMVGGRGTAVDGNFVKDPKVKGLELDAILEDPVMFKEPLYVRVTLRRSAGAGGGGESICQENPMEHYDGEWKYRPEAKRVDF